MALIDKNQPMREAEIDIADFINNRLTNLVQQLAIPGENSIGLEQLDRTMKHLQTIILKHDIMFEITSDSPLLTIARFTVKNNQEAIPDTDYKYIFNGAFASLKAEYSDNLKKNPVFVTTAVESVGLDSVNIAVVLISLTDANIGSIFNGTLSTVWNCTEVSPM